MGYFCPLGSRFSCLIFSTIKLLNIVDKTKYFLAFLPPMNYSN
nr:MAG TPA: hypothetical protein [Caudoviricetes sp.]